jgi:hypothetical protein
MRIATRDILVFAIVAQLGLAAGGAKAQDAAGAGATPPEQIARSVAGSPPASPANPGSYAIQNDLLTGPSLPAAVAGGWMAPANASDLVDPAREELADLDDEAEVQRDPNEPRSIELSEGIRGKLKAKGGGAMLGVTIGFW